MKINIVKPFLPSFNELESSISEILENGMVTNNGKYLKDFELKLKSILKCKKTPIVVNNGESALFNLIQAYKFKITKDIHSTFDVIVPSFTFSGTINAIVLNGLKPIFCDVDESLTIDLTKVKLTKNTKLMLIVGAYGNLPNIDEVLKFSKENNIEVIFDNAPAFLSTYKSDYVCNYGFSETYSFHASKFFNSVEGGCIVTEDNYIHELLTQLRDFGQYEKERGNIKLPGLNSKMSEICAIIGLKNLEKIDFVLSNRNIVIEKYINFFSNLKNLGLVKLMKINNDVSCNYLYFPIILNNECSDFVKYMQNNDITVRRYYSATHTLDFYKNSYSELNLEYTNNIKDNIVSIPLHTVMSDDEIEYLFNKILNYFEL